MPFGVPASPPWQELGANMGFDLMSPMPFGVPASPPPRRTPTSNTRPPVTNAFRRSCFPLSDPEKLLYAGKLGVTNAFRRSCFPPLGVVVASSQWGWPVTNAFRRSCFPPPGSWVWTLESDTVSPMPFGVPASPPGCKVSLSARRWLVTNAFRRSCVPPHGVAAATVKATGIVTNAFRRSCFPPLATPHPDQLDKYVRHQCLSAFLLPPYCKC